MENPRYYRGYRGITAVPITVQLSNPDPISRVATIHTCGQTDGLPWHIRAIAYMLSRVTTTLSCTVSEILSNICQNLKRSHNRELHGNGDGGNTAVTAVIPRIFPVNVAVIPWGWSKLLRGYRGNGAFVCSNTAVDNVCTLKSEVWSSSYVNRTSKCICTDLLTFWKIKSQQWTKL